MDTTGWRTSRGGALTSSIVMVLAINACRRAGRLFYKAIIVQNQKYAEASPFYLNNRTIPIYHKFS